MEPISRVPALIACLALMLFVACMAGLADKLDEQDSVRVVEVR